MSDRQAEASKGNILIVDDTPANLRLLSQILAEQGYKVRPVPSGQLALVAAQAAAPDLILLDIKMPEMNGYEVCERLKSGEQTRDIPIIFISAIDETQDKVKAFAMGGVDYITKPFQFEEVLARVETHLALQNLTKQLKTSLAEKELLLREIHHRVKNNIMVVESLLSLQADYIEDPRVQQMFTESRGRLKTMSLIHEKLYQSQDLARIDFAGYIRKLAIDLFRAYKASLADIDLVLNVEDILLDTDTATHCGLVINELISNALKHAFPGDREGVVRLQLCSDQAMAGKFVLTVSDNGIGFPEDLDFRDTESLGMQLVNTIVTGDLEGTIELDRSSGTTFRITFEEKRRT